MKKRGSKKNTNKRKFWIGIIIIALFIGAVLTGLQTNFYGVAVGVFVGYLVSHLMEKM